MEMKKQKEIMAFLVIISIGLAAFFIPAVSADGGGVVYTQASVNPTTINLGETTTVTLRAFTTAPVPTAGGVYLVLPENVVYAGNASIEPNSIGDNTLEWFIGNLTPSAPWNVSCDVKPLSSGIHSLNVVPDTKVIYGTLTGGGEIPSPVNSEEKANFGFVAQQKDGGTEISGSLLFKDPAKGMKVHSKSINTLTLSGTNAGTYAATFTGTARVGASDYTFTVYVEDNGESGGFDRFAITIWDPAGGNYYSANDTLESGNIQFHSSSGSVTFPRVFVEVKTSTSNQPPVAIFTVGNSTPATNQSAEFDASESRDSDGEIVAYRWDFNGDGTWDIEGNYVEISHCYGEEGIYQVKLEVEDNDGLKDSTTKEINVGGDGGAQEISGNVTFKVAPNLTVPSERQTIGQQVEITSSATVNNTGGETNVSVKISVDGYLISESISSIDGGETPISASTTWIPMSSGRHFISVQVRELKGEEELWIGQTNDPSADKTIFIEMVREK
jgi:hypothetical protein